ncbi:MAG TPA: GNAT family N-acetyltransferase [Candidatus Limnocylindrales bacterium]|nr:GNAT family N-acetyltransferase [Candidatus Limnocylindrales bacterium]
MASGRASATGRGAGFTVRRLRPEDVPAARAIMVRTFEDDFGTGYLPEIHTDVADLVSVYVETPRNALFVAVDDATGEVVATAGVRDGALKPGVSPAHLVARYDPRTTAQLVRVYTLPEHRRRGIATALVRASLEHILADGGYSLVALHTYPHSPGAIGFWQSVGARVVYEDERDGIRTVFMEIPLEEARRFVERR